MKKLLVVLLSILLLSACGSNQADNSSKEEDVFNVGVVQLVQHEALDSATQGFKDA